MEQKIRQIAFETAILTYTDNPPLSQFSSTFYFRFLILVVKPYLNYTNREPGHRYQGVMYHDACRQNLFNQLQYTNTDKTG